MKILIAAILTAGLLVGCASGPGGDGEITISSGVWAKFQEYKNQLKAGDDQYFAASSTGGLFLEGGQGRSLAAVPAILERR